MEGGATRILVVMVVVGLFEGKGEDGSGDGGGGGSHDQQGRTTVRGEVKGAAMVVD